jgi:DNA-binding transcriptional regulator YdaS (Cro superfamily)
MNRQLNLEALRVIAALGGISKTAKLFGIKPPSVDGWKWGTGIPAARLMYIRLARPDLYPPVSKKGKK